MELKTRASAGALMKSRNLWSAGCMVVVLALAAGASALAQDPTPVHFRGVINDYSPSTSSGGPWEIRGKWSLDLQGIGSSDRSGRSSTSGTANFSAALTMETSDYGIFDATHVDPTSPATRSPHTHHIAMTNATVTWDTRVCPANNPPTTGSGVVVTGPASITANGSAAPFEAMGPSTLQVCITGGSQVEFSNISLLLTGPATGHFGQQAIHGVVVGQTAQAKASEQGR